MRSGKGRSKTGAGKQLGEWKAEQTKIRCNRRKRKHSAYVDCSCPRVRQPNRSLPLGSPSEPRSPISEGRKDCELQAGTGETESNSVVRQAPVEAVISWSGEDWDIESSGL